MICGLSPRMYESCWYDTNIPTLWTYIKNRLNNLVDKEANVERALAVGGDKTSLPFAETLKTEKARAK